MDQARTCSRCGRPLASADPACPHCLLELGLALPPRDPEAASAPPVPAGPEPVDAGEEPSIAAIAARFPGLEILEVLGRGGMGVVYKARQTKLARLVALKVLAPRLSRDPAFAERFLREARALARLSHPSIVGVHDFGETEGLCWLLMEYVDGVDLRRVLRAGKLQPEQALRLVPQLCDALAHAHDLGIVHRDIKPENLLLARDGAIKIVDFGLAKLAGEGGGSLTATSQAMGTPQYMAPEQMRASHDVDHRADLYSLGVVFYEMLTGALPVGRFEPPSRKSAADPRVDEIVLHALEHEPERRYQHATEIKNDVETLERSGAGVATHAGAVEAGRGAARAGGRGLAAGVYAALWLVGYLALELEISEALQLALAAPVAALGAPYLALRAFALRKSSGGRAFVYGLAACGAAAGAAVACFPLDTLRWLLPQAALDARADTRFVQLLASALALALAWIAWRARRGLGRLPWSHFTNFAFDLLIVAAALTCGLGTFGSVITEPPFGARPGATSEVGWLHLVMPLFWVGFACDVAFRSVRPEPRAEPRASAAPAPRSDSGAERRRARQALLAALTSTILLALAGSRLLAGVWAARELGLAGAALLGTLLWATVLVATARLDPAFARAEVAPPPWARTWRWAAACALGLMACGLLGRALVGAWERGSGPYASDVLGLRERFFHDDGAIRALARAGLDPASVDLVDPGLAGQTLDFAAGDRAAWLDSCLRGLAFAAGQAHPLVLAVVAAALLAAAGRILLGALAAHLEAPGRPLAAACAVPLLIALGAWGGGRLGERASADRDALAAGAPVEVELEVAASVGRIERALERAAWRKRYHVPQAFRAEAKARGVGHRAATFLGARVEPQSLFDAWDPSRGSAQRRAPALVVEAVELATGLARVRLDLGRCSRDERSRAEGLLADWRAAFEAELARTP